MTSINKIGPKLNAYTFLFQEKVLDEIKVAYQTHISPYLEAPENASLFEGGELRSDAFGTDEQLYFYTTYNKAPLFWVSNNNWHTYTQFNKIFEALNITNEIKRLVDYEEDIILYSGFFVVGNRANDEFWHRDYPPGATNAYTLITPLYRLDSGHGHLLYKDQYDVTKTYVYKTGEAIFLGDSFRHATEPYLQTEVPRILLSLTFGTDKLEHWDSLKSISSQSAFLVLPCGHQFGSCQCLNAYEGDATTELLQQRLKSVLRNAQCPCGSGERFKN